MSSQDQNGISFAIVHEQQRLRLLELPEALLELLTSPDPPQLSIKSSGPTHSSPTNTPPTIPNSNHAVLCTPTQTYHLRQVQTSNSIFVTHPTRLDPDDNNNNNAIPSPALSAIASCNSTLELHPATGSALPYLKAALPLWTGESPAQSSSAMDLDAPFPYTQQERIFAHIPFSPAECRAAWMDLRAFVAPDGVCYRPSPSALTRLWRAMLSASVAEDVDLGAQFRVRDLWSAVCEADEGVPLALVEACVRGLAPEGEEGPNGRAKVDRARCVRWVGATLLEAQGGRPILTAKFMDEWRDNLPEMWRADATLEVIKDVYALPSPTEIVFRSDRGSAEGGSMTEASSGKAAAGKRNWHERFKKGKR